MDFALIDKIAHFDRERIPERVVHAVGSGAHGEFVVTHDVSKWTKANFLNEVGKKTPMFIRFSTVAGSKGASDVVRDPRGFAFVSFDKSEDADKALIDLNGKDFNGKPLKVEFSKR